MASSQDFFDELDKTGVTVTGREPLIAAIKKAEHWPDVVIDLLKVSRKQGLDVWFSRIDEFHPSDDVLYKIVEGYPFSQAQQQFFVGNVRVENPQNDLFIGS